MPVGVALGVSGTLGYAALDGWHRAFLVLGRTPYDLASAYSLSVLPLFILMGVVASRSGMARELFQAANALFSGRRGTLAMATIGACAGMGSISGSSLAVTATMSRVAVPEMRKVGYDDRLATGAVVAGGTLGILIPPSVMLVIYGISAEQSVPRLFAAGLIPGVLLAVFQVLVVAAIARLLPHWTPASARVAWPLRLRAALGMWKLLLIFLFAVGGIYVGWFSPTEAAAMGAFATIADRRRLPPARLARARARRSARRCAPRRCCSSSCSARSCSAISSSRRACRRRSSSSSRAWAWHRSR